MRVHRILRREQQNVDGEIGRRAGRRRIGDERGREWVVQGKVISLSVPKNAVSHM